MVNDEAFVQAIAAEPDSDSARLVYADWLEEHGKPHAADYLRAELELARLPLDSAQAPRLRNRLWQAWATVDPKWLMTFTQPRMLRANPTPFPSAWKNFGLGSLRECQGTYGTWPYDSVPALPLDELRGEFPYLPTGRPARGRGAEGLSPRYRRELAWMLTEAAGKDVRLPEVFVKFLSEPAWLSAFHSVTDCYFTPPNKHDPIRATPSGEGVHVPFYCDSQGCLLWDLYMPPSGGHCVIARWPDFFSPHPQRPNDPQPPYAGPRAWFVAPSFETFLLRVWLENQVWYIEHADFVRREGGSPPPITPAIQAHMDHYRTSRQTPAVRRAEDSAGE
jgi:uncharacterized protein (TIGR02996 family)